MAKTSPYRAHSLLESLMDQVADIKRRIAAGEVVGIDLGELSHAERNRVLFGDGGSEV